MIDAYSEMGRDGVVVGGGAASLSCVVRHTSEVVVVTLDGDLDLTTVARFCAEMTALFQAPRPPIWVDLRALGSLDSVGLAALVQTTRVAARQGSEMILHAPGDRVRATIERSGLRQLVCVA